MNPHAEKAAGQDSAPAGCVYFVEAAKRRAKCRCCKSAIEPGIKHFCIRIHNAGWLRKYHICGSCLGKILQEVKSKKIKESHTESAPEKEREAAVSNIAMPDSASFNVFRKTVESRSQEQAPPSPDADAVFKDCGHEDVHEDKDDVEGQYCEHCGKPIEIDCPECRRKRWEWF